MITLKKRGLIVAIVICLAYISVAQDSFDDNPLSDESVNTPKRVFSGSGSVNLGTYDNYYIRVVAQQKIISGEPGETVHFKLFLRRGDDPAAAHNIRIKGDDPRLTLALQPEIIPELRNIDMFVIQASIDIPSDMPEGKYPIKIRISGKEFVEEPYPLDAVLVVKKDTGIETFSQYALWVTAFVLTGAVFIRTKVLTRKK